MSRKQVSKGEWTVAYGVDHATGGFVQVWRDGDEDREDNPTGAPQLGIDSLGVRGQPFMDKRFNRLVEEFLARFELFERLRPSERPNLGHDDVLAVVKQIDPEWAKEISDDIYKTWHVEPM